MVADPCKHLSLDRRNFLNWNRENGPSKGERLSLILVLTRLYLAHGLRLLYRPPTTLCVVTTRMIDQPPCLPSSFAPDIQWGKESRR